MEERSFHWTVVDERHTAKSADWFWAVGLITITICISAIFLEDILFAVLIFIAGGIFIYNALQGPRTTKCEINKRGIIMNGYLYPYENIESFCFEIDHHSGQDWHEIILKLRKGMSAIVTIPAEGLDPETVRSILLEKLKEENLEEPALSKLMKHLGF
jgi:hypothetical protein